MSDNQVQEIKDKVDIVSVVGGYVDLKKAGRNYKAKCPFHEDKTPSFMVSPELQIYKCFGCGKAGDAYSFLQEIEGVTFPEALETLAQRVGVKLKKGRKSEKERRLERLIEAHNLAADVYHYLLTDHKSGKKALGYLKDRGIEEETIKKFKLGYAPKKWDFIGKYLKGKDFSISEIVEVGLAIPKKSGRGHYDRFRGRIMFPLINSRGNSVAFSARALGDDNPKYLNSPDTPLFSKGSFLYGLQEAKADIRRKGEVIIAEGVLDVISPHQIDVKNIVAPLGTALTLSQLKVLSRLTDTLLLCYDTDTAGRAATKRAIGLAQKQNFSIKVVLLPEGKDPDDLVQEDPEKFKRLVKKSAPVMDYYFKTALSRHNPSTALGKKEISRELLPLIKEITDPVEQSHYIKELAGELETKEEVIRDALEKAKKGGPKSKAIQKMVDSSKDRSQDALEDYMLSLILKAPKDKATSTLHRLGKSDFVNEERRNIFVKLKKYLAKEDNRFDIKQFSARLNDDSRKLLNKCYLRDLSSLEERGSLFDKELENSLNLLKERSIKRDLKLLSRKIKEAEQKGDTERSTKLQNQFQELASKLT